MRTVSLRVGRAKTGQTAPVELDILHGPSSQAVDIPHESS